MEKNYNLVSVFIPTRNRSTLMKRAIDSVIAQTWKNIEIIVVDDASEDDTYSVLTELKKDTSIAIKIFRNNIQLGPSVSRNKAILHSSGEFVTGLDDDDTWKPERIELLMKSFQEGYSGITSDDIIVVRGNEMIRKKPSIISYSDLLSYNWAGHHLLTKKKYLIDIGGYDEDLPSAEDYDLLIRLTEKFGPIKSISQPLYIINIDEDRSRMSNNPTLIRGYYACYKKNKERMTRNQRKYFIYRIRVIAEKDISWLELLHYVPLSFWPKEITKRIFRYFG